MSGFVKNLRALSSPSNTLRRRDYYPLVPNEGPEAQRGSVTGGHTAGSPQPLDTDPASPPTGSPLAGGRGPCSSPFLSPLLRTLVIILGPLDDQDNLHCKTFNLITDAKSLSLCKITYSQVPKIRKRSSLGDNYLA